MRILFGILLVVSIAASLNSYEDQDDGHLVDITVTRLTQNNLEHLTGIHLPFKMEKDKKNLQNDWFIIFYSPHCPHCKKALPEWNEFSRSVVSGRKTSNKHVKIGAVNCLQNYELCKKQFHIQGYPTFLYLTTEYRKYEFSGERTQSHFLQYINQQTFDPLKWSFDDESQLSNFHKFYNQFTWTSVLIIFILLALCAMLVYAIVEPSHILIKHKNFQYTEQFDGLQQANLKAKL